jgi:3-hydroxybutyrate dehydrogenase
VFTSLAQQQTSRTEAARGASEGQMRRDVLLVSRLTAQFVTVEQVAALTVFLCGDDAASITIAVLPIEGGWTTH